MASSWTPTDSLDEIEVGRYLIVATTGAWVWDLLSTLREDVEVYSKYKLQPPDGGFIVGRLMTACFLFASLAFNVSSIDNCARLAKAIGWVGAIALPLLTIPFFFCARAVFLNKPLVISAFAVLWVGALGSNLATPFFIRGVQIDDASDSNRCAFQTTESHAAGIGAVAVHNLIVFVAVTAKLVSFAEGQTFSGRMTSYFHRRAVSVLSQFLMEKGQSHITPIVIFNVAAAAVNLIPSVPSSYKLAFIAMNVALQNVMTIRIHRLIKTGELAESPTGMSATTALNPSVVEIRRGEDGTMSWSHASQVEAMELSQPVVVAMPGAQLDLDRKGPDIMEDETDEKGRS
ncbi:hypothetical protein EIP91_007182 [Steccherinum ochraceum]|uniref:Uncharacterized protein n=1 Tax=Steccherinum ochraceum TaxID=92696 RepID=A0A4R0RYW3_9APHY|nr:hypothetical protein EIP91_007182 [Steccherinum ochraceum]